MIIDNTQDNYDIGILIYRTSSIGDVVLASSCLDLLEKLSLKSKVCWIGSRPSSKLIRNFWPHILVLDLKDFAKLHSLYEYIYSINIKFNIIIDIQRNIRSSFVCNHLSKIFHAKVYYLEKHSLKRFLMIMKSYILGRMFKLSRNVLIPNYYQYDLMSLTLKKALIKEGFCSSEILNIKSVPKLFLNTQNNFILDKSMLWIAVAVGAAHDTKRAPVPVFLDILNKILYSFKIQFSSQRLGLIFLGDHNDIKATNDVINQIHWPFEIKNFCGKLNIEDVPYILSNAKFILSNDSSLVHISEAIGVPAIVMFGPTVEAFGFAPHLSLSCVFSSDLGCRPCSKHGKIPCRYKDKKCFYLINTDMICDKALNILKAIYH